MSSVRAPSGFWYNSLEGGKKTCLYLPVKRLSSANVEVNSDVTHMASVLQAIARVATQRKEPGHK